MADIRPRFRRSDRIWLIAIAAAIVVGAAVRLWAALQWRMNFDGDEALFALMAKHMMHGFFSPLEYGTQHHGTLESLLSAGLMALLGQSVLVFRLSAVGLMTVFLILAAYYFRMHWGNLVGFLATLFLAVPGFHVLEWSYQPIGGYSVMMASGMAFLILTDRIPAGGSKRAGTILVMGVLAGLGLWSNQLMVVYIGAALLALLMGSQEWEAARKWASAKFSAYKVQPALAFGLLTPAVLSLSIGGFFISGCSPTWRFAKLELVFRGLMLTGLLAVGVALFAQSSQRRRRIVDWTALTIGLAAGFAPMWIGWIRGQIEVVNALHRSCPTGIAGRLELVAGRILPALWGVPALETWGSLTWWQQLAWAIIGSLIIFSLIWFFVSRRRSLAQVWLWRSRTSQSQGDLVIIFLFAMSLALNILGNNTVDVYSVRHMLIAGVASAVVFGLAIDRLIRLRRPLGVLSGGFWLAMVALASIQMADGHWRVKFTPYDRADVDQLVSDLRSYGVDSGYADFWGAYTLDYLSDERIAIAPYNGSDRYPDYTRKVSAASSVAFLFPSGRSPDETLGMDGLRIFLKQPSERSGEGPARPEIVEALTQFAVQTVTTTGPWDVWILKAD